MLTELNNLPMAAKCARLLALHKALECPSDPQCATDAAKAELIRLISFQPDHLADAIVLSQKIMFERDFVFGVELGVVYAKESLSKYFGSDLQLTESAIRLCGGMRIDGEWKDHNRSTFVFDKAAIEKANSDENLAGEARA